MLGKIFIWLCLYHFLFVLSQFKELRVIIWKERSFSTNQDGVNTTRPRGTTSYNEYGNAVYYKYFLQCNCSIIISFRRLSRQVRAGLSQLRSMFHRCDRNSFQQLCVEPWISLLLFDFGCGIVKSGWCITRMLRKGIEWTQRSLELHRVQQYFKRWVRRFGKWYLHFCLNE